MVDQTAVATQQQQQQSASQMHEYMMNGPVRKQRNTTAKKTKTSQQLGYSMSSLGAAGDSDVKKYLQKLSGCGGTFEERKSSQAVHSHAQKAANQAFADKRKSMMLAKTKGLK